MIKINKTAKISEIITACFLDEYYFNDVVLNVGDGNKLPDITEENNNFAIEVVSCELEANRDYTAEKKRHDWEVDPIMIINYDSGKEAVYKQFKKIISSKNEKLKKGNYANFHSQIYLAIDSMAGVFDKVDTSAIREVLSEIEIGFTKIFYLTRDGVYLVSKNKCETIRRFEENEFFKKLIEYENKYNYDFHEYK